MSANDPPKFALTLFLVGEGANLVDSISRLLESKELPRSCLTIVDLSKSPEDAETYDILAIPTLIRTEPTPPVRVIGDITDDDRVWRLLAV